MILFLQSVFMMSQSKNQFFFSGNININNNGIDWVPIFSRGKPSLITNFSLGKNRFSVNPLIRYELDGLQPWGFDIWWNYKFVQKKKFKFDIGLVLPGVVNQRVNINQKNLPNTVLQPWVNGLVNPNLSFSINDNFGLSLSYYEIFRIKKVNTNQFGSGRIFVLFPLIKKIGIGDKFYIRWAPQIYTVQVQDLEIGFFYAQTINIGINKFPFSISSVMNKPIYFGGLTGKKFEWNIGVNYSFDLKFTKVNKID